VETDQS